MFHVLFLHESAVQVATPPTAFFPLTARRGCGRRSCSSGNYSCACLLGCVHHPGRGGFLTANRPKLRRWEEVREGVGAGGGGWTRDGWRLEGQERVLMGCGEPDPCDVSTQDGRHIGGTQRNVGMELLQDGGEREEEERGRSLKRDASASVTEKVF